MIGLMIFISDEGNSRNVISEKDKLDEETLFKDRFIAALENFKEKYNFIPEKCRVNKNQCPFPDGTHIKTVQICLADNVLKNHFYFIIEE
jgi:hypothetical protein